MTANPLPPTDLLTAAEYADAGIRHHWIVDLEPPMALVSGHLAEAG